MQATLPRGNTPCADLPTGTVLAGRFTLLAHAGQGGMGTVYRARDERTGHTVALKLLHAAAGDEALQRFTREAELLASLRHPGIVAHVAHGLTEQGFPFLAMEWLEGHDLAQRLASQPLSLAEALTLARRAAEALALAHQHGIVHRDLKPSNLFLRHGRLEEVVLLDFGLARRVLSPLALTESHIVLGTPGYMAPEQASSQGALTPAADLFSLGCVLYECLTGQPPFAAPHFAAVLAKILFAEPAPLRSVRPELPEALQPLMDRLLAKEPQARLPHAQALVDMLLGLEPTVERVGPPAPVQGQAAESLASAEQQLVSVLLAAPQSPPAGAQRPSSPVPALRDSLRLALTLHGARVEWLADGSLVATLLPGHGTATDQAALAARYALSLQEHWPESWVVLATGRGVLRQHLPMGEVMDRAGQLLHQREQLAASAAGQVLLDGVTAGLLGPGFQLSRPAPHLFLLHGERLSMDESRPLLGRPTPCVGREQELALLELAYGTCVEEPASRALLVVAPPGTGKSRLRHEFLRRLESRGHRPLVLFARGDPLGAGSAGGLLGQALRRLCGIADAEPSQARGQELARRVALHLPADQASEVVEFLAELCGLRLADQPGPRLRAARADPKLMSAQVAQALAAFLRAECQHHPVLLVLDDLHWGDALTVRLVDEALRALADQPLLVLALARPEVRELFPGLWARCLQELPLRGLSRKACARLVREVLGEEVPPPTVERLVEQSSGNALFLEELIRTVAEGQGEAPPETVLAMLQARLLRLEPQARQVLLAGSLFGRNFWSGGVQALLGEGGQHLAQRLAQLVELEVVEPQPGSRFAGEAEYRFRHALVREAAYGLVPEGYRATGHRLVAAWLEQVGESEPQVLAEHYQLAAQPERALPYLTRAAEQLFRQYDLRGTLRCVETGLALGARGQELTRLRAYQAVAAFWRDDFAQSYELGSRVLPELEAGSYLWCRLIGGLLFASALGGRQAYTAELGALLLGTTPEPEALGVYLETVCFLSTVLTWCGARERSGVLLARVEGMGAGLLAKDAVVRGWQGLAQSLYLYHLGAQPWQALAWAERGNQAFGEVGSERNQVSTQAMVGVALAALGEEARAVAQLRESLETARRTEQRLLMAYTRSLLALVLAGSSEPGHQEEAWALALEGVGADQSNHLQLGIAHTVLARVALRRGELAEAEARARRACELLGPFGTYLLAACRLLSAVLRAQGRLAEARAVAERGVQALEAMGGQGTWSVGVHLALAEVCLAQGESPAAEAALRQALHCLHTRAADIPEPAARERFLHQVPENARTLALARQCWG